MQHNIITIQELHRVINFFFGGGGNKIFEITNKKTGILWYTTLVFCSDFHTYLSLKFAIYFRMQQYSHTTLPTKSWYNLTICFLLIAYLLHRYPVVHQDFFAKCSVKKIMKSTKSSPKTQQERNTVRN